ncbi:MAG: hypothetical protein JWN37_664 [Candidatus Nomurabacteria bacterium]|nr:hypothetical protein [Candidatus Nomurabacteria bacterium]
MQEQNQKRAVLYCRVSTKEQVDEGNSLNTQEKLCKEYALKHGYEVAQVFVEQGESAKTTMRTELQKMLFFCSDKKNRISAVISYKIDRLSRNTDDYSQLRILLKRYGVEIRSVSEAFENNPSGRFMENMLANVAQFDNEVRAERCTNGMRDAVRDGRYVWMAPIGYENVRTAGMATIAKSHMAPFVKETFILIAKNTHSLEEVRKIMTEKGLRLKNGNPLSKQYFYKLIRSKLYYGCIEKFGESHMGAFESVIDESLFNQVQLVLKNRGKKMSHYKLDSEDFPLRRFVTNKDGRKLTGSWCSGRSAKYPYYRFHAKDSNFPKQKFEESFMKYMDQFTLSSEQLEKLKIKVKEKLDKAIYKGSEEQRRLESHIALLKERQTILITKNIEGTIPDHLLKEQLELVGNDITQAQTKLISYEGPHINVEEAFDVASEYFKSPSSIWKEADLDKKLKLQWFHFPQGVVYNEGNYETAEVASIFKTKEAFQPLSSSVVDPSGFEPLAS